MRSSSFFGLGRRRTSGRGFVAKMGRRNHHLKFEPLEDRRMLSVTLQWQGTYETGIFGGSAAEIVSYDPDSERLFVTNAEDQTVDVLDISDPTEPVAADGIDPIDVSGIGDVPTSVSVPGGELVFDSGDDFEQITAVALPDGFNSNNDENDSLDKRSDDKGPEPEYVVVGQIGERTYAFVGLERVGGIMVYDVTDPHNASFESYVNTRDFDPELDPEDAGDLGPARRTGGKC